MELSPIQKQVVESKEKYVVVNSCAGSGKTTTLAERVKYLLKNGVPADKIVVITFTNAELFSVKTEPRTAFFHDAHVGGDIEDGTGFTDTLVVHDVKFRDFERRSHFVFDDFDPRPVAGDGIADFDRGGFADVHADGGVEFQRIAAGGGFRIAVHHADFFTDLVGKDDAGFAFACRAGEFTQSL